MLAGLISSLALIAVSPVLMGNRAIFPLENPGIVSIPIGLAGAILGTLLARDRESEAMFDQLQVRATTGLEPKSKRRRFSPGRGAEGRSLLR